MTDPRCFFCNVDLIPTMAHVDSGLYFCGGEPVCICADPPPSTPDIDIDRLVDDGNPHDNDDEYEFMQSLDMPAWAIG